MTDLDAHIELTRRQATSNYRIPVTDYSFVTKGPEVAPILPEAFDLAPSLPSREEILNQPYKRGRGRPRKHQMVTAQASGQANAMAGGIAASVGCVEPVDIALINVGAFFKGHAE